LARRGGGKHPLTPHGFKDATTNEHQITAWWTEWPDANIATPTGAGRVVLDVDKRHGGLESFALLEKKYGQLPATLTSRTGSGGNHLIYASSAAIRSVSNALDGYPGIDTRADGGYIILPPSRNEDGRYEFEDCTVPLACLPEYLEKLLAHPHVHGNGRNGAGTFTKVREGGRNSDAISLAGTMRRKGGDAESIFAYLVAENPNRYDPPLPEQELRAVAESVCRYAPEAGPETPVPVTESANAIRLVNKCGQDIRYLSDRRVWCAWNGRHWCVDDAGTVARAMGTIPADIYLEAAGSGDKELRTALGAWARQSESRRVQDNSIALTRYADGIEVRKYGDVFDRHHHLLNVENGTIDLLTGKLREHRRDDYLTKLVPIAYEPEATCPRFDQFMQETFPAAAVREYMQRFAGYCLTGDTTEQSWWVFYGETATGKSTLVRILRGLLGPYAFELPENYFLLTKNQGADYTTAMLAGVRLATCVETNEGRRLDVAKVKQLTGQDSVSASLKYQNLFEFEMTAKLVLATNDRPEIPASDGAIWRRVKQVDFGVSVPKERQVGDLSSQLLAAEGPGILAWAIRGLQAYRKLGKLGEPKAVEDAVQQYKNAGDTVQEYIDERLNRKPGARVSKRELYADYSDWAKGSNIRPIAKTRLTQELARLGFMGSDDRRYVLDAERRSL
jgi:putative DNA primase/helicase